MAIAKIKKIEAIGLQQDKEQFLHLLQKLGTVELIGLEETGMHPCAQPASGKRPVVFMARGSRLRMARLSQRIYKATRGISKSRI